MPHDNTLQMQMQLMRFSGQHSAEACLGDNITRVLLSRKICRPRPVFLPSATAVGDLRANHRDAQQQRVPVLVAVVSGRGVVDAGDKCQVSGPCLMMHVYQKSKGKQGTGFGSGSNVQETGDVRTNYIADAGFECQCYSSNGGELGIKIVGKRLVWCRRSPWTKFDRRSFARSS